MNINQGNRRSRRRLLFEGGLHFSIHFVLCLRHWILFSCANIGKTTKVIMRLPLFDCKHYGNRAQGFFSKVFFLFPSPPQKRVKSVLPVGRGRAQPATRSLLIWGGGLLPIRATCEKPANRSSLCNTGSISE